MDVAQWALALGIANAAFSGYIWWRQIRTKVEVSIGPGTGYYPSGGAIPALILEGINRSGHDVFVDDVRIIWNGADKRVSHDHRPKDNRIPPHRKYKVALGLEILMQYGLALPAKAQGVLILDTEHRFESKVTHLG